MTIDEAIKHCLEVAEKHKRHAKILEKRLLGSGLDTVDYCLQCAADHRQLAEWLTELKEYREDDWKKVEEEIPEPWYIVLVWREIGTTEMATWARDKWLSENHSRPLSDVKYWRTLKIPKEERRTKNDT